MAHYQSFRRRGSVPAGEPNSGSTPDRSLAARWGSAHVFSEGFLAVPATLLRHYNKLNLSNSELVFILQLMSFKWNETAPYPSYGTLAVRMGITTEMARRHAKSLEEKGLLKRVTRTGQSNAFD